MDDVSRAFPALQEKISLLFEITLTIVTPIIDFSAASLPKIEALL
jgi:hypothetical protein